MTDQTQETPPEEHEHSEYDTDVPNHQLLEPDFDAEDTDEADEEIVDDGEQS